MRNNLQSTRINSVIHFIHSDISRDLSAAALAKVASYSEQHFHRVFKQQMGESVNNYVRKVRLETAANQLMFTPDKSVSEIILKCGFESVSSFGKIFKQRFGVSPARWRTNANTNTDLPYLANEEIAAAYRRLENTLLPDVEYVNLEQRQVAYIRHKGYSRSIKVTWQLLQAWAIDEGIPSNTQLGLHHSNPTQTPLDECHYVACIEIDKPLANRGLINSMIIPGGVHAKFDFSGKYGELLPSISKVLSDWLPNSGLIAKTTPAFVLYHKNHFIDPKEQYDLSFYLPISFY